MVSHSWIPKCMEVLGVAANVRSFVNASMTGFDWLKVTGDLKKGKIKPGIFQGNSLSPLLFVLVIILLTLNSRQINASYKVKEEGKKINHLLFIDDLKLLNCEKWSLVNKVRTFSEDTKIRFRLPKCGVLIMKRGKVVKSEGINLPNEKMIKSIEEGEYKYLGISDEKLSNIEKIHQKSQKYTKV